MITIAGSSSRYHISKDTGITWQTSNIYPEGDAYNGLGISALSITPSGRFVFGGAAGVVADSISGIWRRPYVNTTLGSTYSRVRFPDKDHGALAGYSGSIAITMDNGVTWIDRSNLADRAGNIGYPAMDYPSTDALFIATTQGVVRFSSDQGETFDQIFVDSFKTSVNSSNPPIYAMDWIDNNQGWLVSWRGHNNDTRQSPVFFTKDGGLTWDSVKTAFPSGSISTPRITDIVFVNERIGYAAGTRGTIWKTTDGGLSWDRAYYGADSTTRTFAKLSVVDSNTVWAVANGGVILRTIDGGMNWMDARGDFPSTANLLGIKAYDEKQAFLTFGSMIFFTNNGGANWSAYSAPLAGIGVFLEDLEFTPLNPGCGSEVCNALWAVGGGASILKFGSDKVLPVKFTTLTGTATGEGNQLFWSAFEQKDVKHFEVEGSTDGRKFSTLEKNVFATGLNSSSYKWIHKDAPSGQFYYRVKAVEISGSMYFTNTITVDNKISTGWRYALMPGALTLNNARVLRGTVSVQMVNTSGQVMAARNWKQSGGAFNEMINLPGNAHGIYFIKVVNEGYSQTFKVFIP